MRHHKYVELLGRPREWVLRVSNPLTDGLAVELITIPNEAVLLVPALAVTL